jgi:hypothetical protein
VTEPDSRPDPKVREGVPAFVRVYDRLREYVARDALEPGELMPTEVVLAGELSVPRELVREALLLLEEDGHLARDNDWRWRVAAPRVPAGFSDPFPDLLGGALTADRRLHAAVETGSTWSRELLGSSEPFLVWETVFSHGGVVLASTLEVMLESALPDGVADCDWLDVDTRPTLLGCVPAERRSHMTLELWRLTPLSRNTERLSWMELPMHGIAVGLTVVLAEDDKPTYLAKNIFDLGTFDLAAIG